MSSRASRLLSIAPLLVAAACGPSNRAREDAARPRGPAVDAQARAPRRVVQGSGYQVRLTLEQQRDFPGTPHIFVGTVQELLAARHVVNEYLEFVYTPVVLRVDRVVRGTLPVTGSILLRALGGSADGVEFHSEMAPAAAVLRPGARLLVFGPEQVVGIGDEPIEALTPNGIFLITGDSVIDATFADENAGGAVASKMSLATAELMLGTSLQP